MCPDSVSKDSYLNIEIAISNFGISGLEKCPFPYKDDLILPLFERRQLICEENLSMRYQIRI